LNIKYNDWTYFQNIWNMLCLKMAQAVNVLKTIINYLSIYKK